MAWHGMAWHGMAWDGTWDGMGWNGMGWHGMAWHGMGWDGMAWHGMAWHGMVWDGMGWDGMGWDGIEWHGMVWDGMAWHGMVWYGMVWDGMGWDGMGWDGMGWDGMGWDGMDGMGWMGWDGMGWDGMGWDGMGWHGMGWHGMGWDGMGWDGMGWDGMGWDGMVVPPVETMRFRPRGSPILNATQHNRPGLLQDILDTSGLLELATARGGVGRAFIATAARLLRACVESCPEPATAGLLLDRLKEQASVSSGAMQSTAMPAGHAEGPEGRSEDRLVLLATRRIVRYYIHWGFLVCREMVAELEAGLEAAEAAGDGSSSSRSPAAGTVPGAQLWDHVAQSLSRRSPQAHGSALHRMAKQEAAAAANRSRAAHALGAAAGAAPPVRRTLTLSDLRASLGSAPRTTGSMLCSTRLVLRPASGGHLGCTELRVGDLVRLSPVIMPCGLMMDVSSDGACCPCGHNCTVAEVDFTCVTLEVALPAIHNPSGRLWRLDQLGSLSTFSHTMRALEKCCSQALVEEVRAPSRGDGSSRQSEASGGSSSSLLQLILGSWQGPDSPQGEGGGPSGSPSSCSTTAAACNDAVLGGDDASRDTDRVHHWQETTAFPDLPPPPRRNTLVGNESQCRAAAAAASDMLVLIHGPPGTGKVRPVAYTPSFCPHQQHIPTRIRSRLCLVLSLRTTYFARPCTCQTTTIAQALLLMLQQRMSAGQHQQQQLLPVLVAAQTNVAVDNILDRLLSAESGAVEELLGAQADLPSRLPRVGAPSSVRKSLQKYDSSCSVPDSIASPEASPSVI